MAKDRLKDTIDHLEALANAGGLVNIKASDIKSFKSLVEGDDKTNNGAVLSLDWSWYNATRPSKIIRHTIRAYLLVSLYNDDLLPANTKAEAVRIKMSTTQWFNAQISQKLSELLGLDDPMNINGILFKSGAAGHGTHRATAVCVRQKHPIVPLMSWLNRRGKTAVVVIDMQSGGDVGQLRKYGDKTVLECQQAVLRKAASMNLVIYDIVIDANDAGGFGPAYDLATASQERKDEIVARQRRPSYAEAATIKTTGVLRNLYTGGLVRHIPKPSHPSFIGTLFAEHLEQDGIESVIVMGYDANQCVKATVFGAPSVTREEGVRMPTAAEVTAEMERNPALSMQQAQKLATPMHTVTDPYTRGLLDRRIDVFTSRSILASGYAPLDQEWTVLAGHR